VACRSCRTLGNLHFLSQVLFGRLRPFWRHCLWAFPIALIPSLALAACVYASLTILNVSMDGLIPPRIEASFGPIVMAVIVAPVVETLLLAGVLRLLSIFSTNTPFVATVSALFWGALHAANAVLWFFGTVWTFFVFSCVYLSWRKVSFKHAYAVALVPHMLLNVTAIVLMVVMESPNPSIERTSQSLLRSLWPAAHVER